MPDITDREPRMTTKAIADMRPGEEGWTVPWAVHKPSGLRWLLADYYLHTGFGLSPLPGGTATLRVYRDGAGWHIDDSSFRSGFGNGDSDRYHLYWRDGHSVPVRSVTL